MKKRKDYCKYVNVFYGNGELDHYPEESNLGSRWFYVKALCGNTTPHAVLPFGKMSVGAYSGGYPTGYGTHYPNGGGKIDKLSEVHQIRGFSHLHQSGTGAMKYYYNYAITTPFYGPVRNIKTYHSLKNENARPGYYTVQINDVKCELTVNSQVAIHKYQFMKEGGRVAVDFSNDGLSRMFDDKRYAFPKEAIIEKISHNCVFFSALLSGVRLYFAVVLEGEKVSSRLFNDASEVDESRIAIDTMLKPAGTVFDFEGDEVVVKLSYSTLSSEAALQQICESTDSFEDTAIKAYDIWNEYLSKIEIDTENEEMAEKFYSSLYHSLIKPIDMTGENVLGVKGDVVADIATFWDQYKTVFPLIFTLYPEMGGKIVKGIANISKTLGKLPCSFGVTDIFPCEMQSKMNAIMTLLDAYHCGIKEADVKLIEECTKRELEREDFAEFLKTGFFERYTHILDTTDACYNVALITQDEQFKTELLEIAQYWANAYGEDGLMSENSVYYEGDKYTYSFRLQNFMEERIKLAGGRENFVQFLDDFFGFNGDSIKDDVRQMDWREIEEKKYHRFEGFNNECDMETPYAYDYVGRNDRVCEIVHECVTNSFTVGTGGLPGNNDSGGLTSCFLWNVLGIFPVSGKGEFAIGSPHVKGATIHLSTGKHLRIETRGLTKENYYVKSVWFNGERLNDYRIDTKTIMGGGTILFEMAGEP